MFYSDIGQSDYIAVVVAFSIRKNEKLHLCYVLGSFCESFWDHFVNRVDGIQTELKNTVTWALQNPSLPVLGD